MTHGGCVNTTDMRLIDQVNGFVSLTTKDGGCWNHYPTSALWYIQCGGSVAMWCSTWKVELLHLDVHAPLIWFQMHNIPRAQSVGPSRVNSWHVWSCEIHESSWQWVMPPPYIYIYVYSLLWMVIHIGRDVTGLETLLKGKTCKKYRSVWLCVAVCECLCSWSGGEWAFTWGCFVEHIICNLSFKSNGGRELSVLCTSNNQPICSLLNESENNYDDLGNSRVEEQSFIPWWESFKVFNLCNIYQSIKEKLN